MQITTAARRITRTVNAYTRGGDRLNHEIYFDADGHEVHSHTPTGGAACQSVYCLPDGDGRYQVIVPRSPITQAYVQEQIIG